MSAHHKQISFNFLVWMTAQAIQHHLWVANPQRIYFFLFQCYCHGNWLNCRSRLHLYCSLIFILICRHSSGARKRQRMNQYCSLKHILCSPALCVSVAPCIWSLKICYLQPHFLWKHCSAGLERTTEKIASLSFFQAFASGSTMMQRKQLPFGPQA